MSDEDASRRRIEVTLNDRALPKQGVTTNWYVVTGSPGSGKTTVVTKLKEYGLVVIPDHARLALESRLASGLSKESARMDYMTLQNEILAAMDLAASSVEPAQLAIFDYALPDNLVFLRVANLEWTSAHVEAACRYRYRRAFLLDPLDRPPLSDPVRTESLDQRKRIHLLLRELYRNLGTPITPIPVGPLEDRVELIVRTIATENGGYLPSTSRGIQSL